MPAEVMTTSLGSARRPGTESKVKLGKSIVFYSLWMKWKSEVLWV